MSPLASSFNYSFGEGYSTPRIVTNGLVLNLDAGLQSSYNGGTTWTDLSGLGNNGTLTNGPTYSSANGGSIVFNGTSSQYVTLGNNKLQYQDNFTVEAFCRFTNLPNNPGTLCSARHPIVYNYDYGYNLFVQSDGKVALDIWNTSSANGNPISANSVVGSKYFHVVGTKSGKTCSLYLNGAFEASANLTTNSVYYATLPYVIGGFAKCGNDRFYATGNISLVKVYNRALSQTEIQQNFNALRGRYGI